MFRLGSLGGRDVSSVALDTFASMQEELCPLFRVVPAGPQGFNI